MSTRKPGGAGGKPPTGLRREPGLRRGLAAAAPSSQDSQGSGGSGGLGVDGGDVEAGKLPVPTKKGHRRPPMPPVPSLTTGSEDNDHDDDSDSDGGSEDDAHQEEERRSGDQSWRPSSQGRQPGGDKGGGGGDLFGRSKALEKTAGEERGFHRQTSRRIRWIPTVEEMSNTVANLAHRNDRLRRGPSQLAMTMNMGAGARAASAKELGKGGAASLFRKQSNPGITTGQHGNVPGARGSLRYAESFGSGGINIGRRPLHDAWRLTLPELKALLKHGLAAAATAAGGAGSSPSKQRGPRRHKDINAIDVSGSTPLMYFAENAPVEHALLLLDYGADIEMADFMGGNALSRASALGRADMVAALYSWVVKHNSQAEVNLMLWAAHEGQTGLLEVLLNQELLDVDRVMEESNRHTALHIGAMSGHLPLVEMLISYDADLTLADVNQNTALHLALMERNVDIARALIRAGAPLDEPNRSNKVPLDLCAETMTLSEFMALTEDAYHGLVTLICPFILRTSMPHKHHVLCDVLAGRVEEDPPDDQQQKKELEQAIRHQSNKLARRGLPAAAFDDADIESGSTAINTDAREEEEEEREGEGEGEEEALEDEEDGGGDMAATRRRTVVVGTGNRDVEMTPPSLGDIGRAGAVRALKTLGATFTVRYNFNNTQVFALDRNRREDWEESLAEEYGAAAERLFLTVFFTATEGRNLCRLYIRNVDPIGLCMVGLSYLASLSLAGLVLLIFALAALFSATVVLGYIALARIVLWLPWRYLISPTYYSCRRGLRWLRRRGKRRRPGDGARAGGTNRSAHGSGDEEEDDEDPRSARSRSGSLATPQTRTPGTASSAGSTSVGSNLSSCEQRHHHSFPAPPYSASSSTASASLGHAGSSSTTSSSKCRHHSHPRALLHYKPRHSVPHHLMVLYKRYSPSYLTARMISAFYSQWETLRTNRNRRTTEVISKHINLLGVCEAEPDGVLSPLVTFNVPSFVFGIEPVQAVIDYKFRTFGRAVLKTEGMIYLMLLLSFSSYLLAVHDLASHMYRNIHVDWWNMRHRENVLSLIVTVLLARVFKHELTNFYRCFSYPGVGGFRRWAASIWSWMNALGFPLYLYTVVFAPHAKVPYYLAIVALMLWWKSLYFLKGFRATGTLVQMVTGTIVEVRWFVLMLLIIGFGFGSGFFILFRVNSARWATAQRSHTDTTKPYRWSSPATVYLSMLSILLGNFEVEDFVSDNDADTAMAISFLVAYIVLVVIVMLNLLIAIVSRVYERCQVNYEEEFLRAKAELICQIEQGFFMNKDDPVWFPPKLYFISKLNALPRGGAGDPNSSSSFVGGGSLFLPSAQQRAKQQLQQEEEEAERHRRHQHHHHQQQQQMKRLQREIDRLTSLQSEASRRQAAMDDKLQAALLLLQSLHQQQTAAVAAAHHNAGPTEPSIDIRLASSPPADAEQPVSSLSSDGGVPPSSSASPPEWPTAKRPPPLFSPLQPPQQRPPSPQQQRIQEIEAIVSVPVPQQQEQEEDASGKPASPTGAAAMTMTSTLAAMIRRTISSAGSHGHRAQSQSSSSASQSQQHSTRPQQGSVASSSSNNSLSSLCSSSQEEGSGRGSQSSNADSPRVFIDVDAARAGAEAAAAAAAAAAGHEQQYQQQQQHHQLPPPLPSRTPSPSPAPSLARQPSASPIFSPAIAPQGAVRATATLASGAGRNGNKQTEKEGGGGREDRKARAVKKHGWGNTSTGW